MSVRTVLGGPDVWDERIILLFVSHLCALTYHHDKSSVKLVGFLSLFFFFIHRQMTSTPKLFRKPSLANIFLRVLRENDGIEAMTKALVFVSTMPSLEAEAVLEDGFVFLDKYLQEGEALVVQSLKGGLLQLFTNCVLSFSRFKPVAFQCALRLLRDTLPSYLVFGSVIQAIRPFYTRIQEPGVKSAIDMGPLDFKGAWYSFVLLALRRSYLHSVDEREKRKYCDGVCAGLNLSHYIANKGHHSVTAVSRP